MGRRSAFAFLFACVVVPRATAQVVLPPNLITFNDNGAWSWFSGERVTFDAAGGNLLVSSVADASGVGGAARSGNVEVASYHVPSGQTQRFTLSPNLQADDHNSAALYVRPDGRYVATYSRHGTDNFTRWRVSTNPHDATAWQPEQTFNNGVGTTYSNVYHLSAANGGAGQLYNFTRTNGFDPNFLVSNDQGQSWAYGGRLLNDNLAGGRPYVRYAGNGTDKVFLVATDGHPRNVATNSIYFGYVEAGQLKKSGGAVVDANLFDTAAVQPSALTKIFTGGPTTANPNQGPAWTTDIRIDPAGNPYVAFSVRVRPPNQPPSGFKWDHDYYYARYDGTDWQVSLLARGGRELDPGEGDYTGLVALDPRNRNRVVISTDAHPETNAPLISATDGQRHYELFEGLSADGGLTWDWTAVTANSSVDNLRPVIPEGDGVAALVWLRGSYTTYLDYDLAVVGTVVPVPEPAGLVAAGVVVLAVARRVRRRAGSTP